MLFLNATTPIQFGTSFEIKLLEPATEIILSAHAPVNEGTIQIQTSYDAIAWVTLATGTGAVVTATTDAVFTYVRARWAPPQDQDQPADPTHGSFSVLSTRPLRTI